MTNPKNKHKLICVSELNRMTVQLEDKMCFALQPLSLRMLIMILNT